MARIKPLYKKNSPLDVGNYRPVSIFSKEFFKEVYIPSYLNFYVKTTFYSNSSLVLETNIQLIHV